MSENKVWESVVFLQGEEANQWLDYLERETPHQVLKEMCALYFDEEVPGSVFFEDPKGETDKEYREGGLLLTWNKAGYIGITRVMHIPSVVE